MEQQMKAKQDTRSIGALIFLVALAAMAIIMLCCCTPVSMLDVPTEQKRAEELYRIVSYENYAALATLYPQYRSHRLGLIDEDFKRYVLKEVEGTGYIDIRWYHVGRMDMTYIAFAYVYYPKKEER